MAGQWFYSLPNNCHRTMGAQFHHLLVFSLFFKPGDIWNKKPTLPPFPLLIHTIPKLAIAQLRNNMMNSKLA